MPGLSSSAHGEAVLDTDLDVVLGRPPNERCHLGLVLLLLRTAGDAAQGAEGLATVARLGPARRFSVTRGAATSATTPTISAVARATGRAVATVGIEARTAAMREATTSATRTRAARRATRSHTPAAAAATTKPTGTAPSNQKGMISQSSRVRSAARTAVEKASPSTDDSATAKAEMLNKAIGAPQTSPVRAARLTTSAG